MCSSSENEIDVAMGLLLDKYGAKACSQSLQHLVAGKDNSNNGPPSAPTNRQCPFSPSNKALHLENAMLDCSFDSIFLIDDNGVILHVNTAAIRQFGYETMHDMLGKNISIIIAGPHAAHHNQYLKRYKQTRQGSIMGTQRELTAVKKDGTEFPCVLGLQELVVPRDDDRGKEDELYFFASLRDVSKEKQIRELLSRIERDKKAQEMIIQASFEAFFTTDVKGIITFVNRAALKQFGYDKEEEMVGQNISIIVGGGHAAHHGTYMKEFLQTRVKKIIGSQREVPARRRDGSEFPANLGIDFIEPGGALDPFFIAFIRDLSVEKREMELQIENRKTEDLLLNMLPNQIADRLKGNPIHMADHHECATILFADIVGFTSLSSKLKPIEVVEMLNDLFSRFDALVEKYNLNKVKTIGDCYMVTSIPGGDAHCEITKCTELCHFAFDMLDAIQEYCHANPHRPLEMRIGMNSGPVIAGIVGTKRFLYDIWGDAVNLASRMESSGIAGRIQVTASVIDVLPEGEFATEARGPVHIKGKGDVETFFLTRRIAKKR